MSSSGECGLNFYGSVCFVSWSSVRLGSQYKKSLYLIVFKLEQGQLPLKVIVQYVVQI